MSTVPVAKFHRSIPLARTADVRLREALAAGRLGVFRRIWLKGIEKPRRRMLRRFPQKSWLVLWSADSVELCERERQLAAALESSTPRERSGKRRRRGKRPLEQALSAWHADVSGRPNAWESLAVAEVLLRAGDQLEAETFANCLAVLARAINRPSVSETGDLSDDSAPATDLAPLHCEAAWVLGLLLAPLSGSAKLQRSGMAALQQLLRGSTDRQGLPLAAALPRLPAIFCTLSRSTAWSRIFQQPLWSDFETHLQCLVEAGLLLLVPPQPSTGAADTDNSCPPAPFQPLIPALQQLLDDDSGDHAPHFHKLLRKAGRPVTTVRPPKRFKPSREIVDEEAESDSSSTESSAAEESAAASLPAITTVSWQSDDGRVAVLRSSARADADVVIVDWHAGTVQLQVYAAGVRIFSGPWHWSARLNDEQVVGPAAWKCSCWFDDPECVFLELEADCGNGLQGVRQLMLATHERFLMLTDSVTAGTAEPRLQLTTALPFSEGVVVEPHPVTREMLLSRGPAQLRLIPAWLDDDRVQHTFGQCQAHDGQLESSAPGSGGVTLPLAIDWHPQRVAEPADWARLTVTEARRYTGMHEASGFRIRTGSFQLLLYRSLMTGRDSRAVLGLHTWDETVYTRVPGRKTPMEPLVSVETPE
ncbi:MAG: hypothetical protein RL215_1652 [Planctomycetota bacterium]|jgi:hypothetical protein